MSERSSSPPRLARPDSRPILVTLLVAGWLILSGFGALRALLVLGNHAATSLFGETDPTARAAAAAPDLGTDETKEHLARREERLALDRVLAGPLLFVATLGVAGALGLLRRRSWSRPLLVAAGLLALGLSAFHAHRSVAIAASPVAGLAESEPEARDALALLRAAAGINLALQSIPLVLAMSLLRHPVLRDYLGVRTERRLPRGKRVALLVAGGTVLLAAVAVLFSKSRTATPPPAKSEAVAPRAEPRETFDWGGQPVAFSPPPPESWTRERHAEGGRKGISFTRYAVPPSRIILAEASVSTSPRAVEDVFPQFRLTPERFRSADSALVGEPLRAVVGGLPAFQTDYTLRERSMQHRGREFVTVAGGHAFVLGFLGRETDLPVFESLVASVRFPAAGRPDAGVPVLVEESAGEETVGDVADLRIGRHRVSVRIPPGWERIDYGQRQEFRRGETRIALVDGGDLPFSKSPDAFDEETVARALRLFRHDPRRWEIAGRTLLSAGPRKALAVDTWDPLSHALHQRTILLANRGRLLVAGMFQGTWGTTAGSLDALVGSVRFQDEPGDPEREKPD